MHKFALPILTLSLFSVASASAQTTGAPEKARVDFVWQPSQDEGVGLEFPGFSTPIPAYAPGINSGARSIAGPVDLDNDGKMEVVLSDYSGGGRVHVIENVGVDMWELAYSSVTLDPTVGSSNNARGVGAGNLDGDDFGEIYLFVGHDLPEDAPVLEVSGGPRLGALEATGDNEFSLLPNWWDFDGEENIPDRFRTERMMIADVDGDEIDELLFANNGAANPFDSWYVVSASDLSAFATWTQEARFTSRSDSVDGVNRGGGSAYSIIPADFDGDGSHELALGSWNNLNFSNVDVTGADTYVSPSGDHAYYRASEIDDVSFFGCVAVDMDMNGDDEVYCPSLGTGDIAIINYEEGENPLEIRKENVVYPLLEAGISLGITAGDIDGDGAPELIGTGQTYTSSNYESGSAPRWVVIVDYNNFYEKGVEDPSSYRVRHVEFPMPEEMIFNTVNRDSAGVKTTFMEGSAGFAGQFAYLGDVDGDGENEVAMSFQGVPDSVYVFDEVFNPDDSTYARTVSSAVPNPHRAFMRVLSGDGLTTRISHDRVIVPADFELHSNYPNPFNPSTTFSFTLPLDKRVSVRIYDMTGRLVRTLINDETYVQGTHSVTWNGLGDSGAVVASGQYIYTLEWGQFRQARRMVLVK